MINVVVLKRIICILLIIFAVVYPEVVKANIVCNDGTISKTCGDCHRGCCSHHGGCSNYNYQTTTTRRSTTTTTMKYNDTTIGYNINYEEDDPVYNNTNDINNTTKNEEDNSVYGAIGALSLLGAGAYVGNKVGKKKGR